MRRILPFVHGREEMLPAGQLDMGTQQLGLAGWSWPTTEAVGKSRERSRIQGANCVTSHLLVPCSCPCLEQGHRERFLILSCTERSLSPTLELFLLETV